MNISVNKDKDKHVLISSKNIHNSLFCFLAFSFISVIFLHIYLSVIPGCIFIISTTISPLFNNWLNFLIKAVLPQPVSPINITGISAIILYTNNTIFLKLSLVIT